MFSFSKRSLERLDGVDRRLIDVLERALQLSPYDFGVAEHGGVRSAEEQNALFKAGASRADGYVDKSNHQFGIAADVYGLDEGKLSYEPVVMATIAAAILQSASELGYHVEWGGFWRSIHDTPHFQIRG